MANGDNSQNYGITPAGFVPKPLGTILEDAFARAREAFGPDIDLRSSSPLRKILELCAAEDALTWNRMEDLYYGIFIPTANGQQLNHLGYDLGLERRYLYAHGEVNFQLGGEPKDGCNYILPFGTVVETAGGLQFRTLERLLLTKAAPQGQVSAIALRRGPASNVNSGMINMVNEEYARRFLRFPPPAGHVQIIVQNPLLFSDGDALEDDVIFRRRLMDLPHTLWTAEAIRRAVLDVDGVRDCLVWDPYGGLDRTRHWFGSFKFKQRMFTAERDLCSPYFFDMVVAPQRGVVWESSGNLPGVRDDVEAYLRDRRPISIFPNIVRACEVQIGVRCRVIYRLGLDADALLSELKHQVGEYILRLAMGDDVLFSEVLCAILAVPGVIDVRDLRLVRCPLLYGDAIFCKQLEFQDQAVEAGCEENIVLDTREIASFYGESPLVKIEVRPQ